MGFLADMTGMDWIIMIAVFAFIGGAYWLVDDSRRRGMQVGGKMCGGCPHYCRMDRNCDGTPKTKAETGEPERAGEE